MKDRYVFDIEADGLLDTITKIHCLSYCNVNTPDNIVSITNYEEMREFFLRENIIRIGHNIVLFDERALEKVLEIKTNKKNIIDTLPLAWYLEPTNRKKYGLDSYGEEFGVPKPKILDWANLSPEEYIHRCEEDVKINTILFKGQWAHLKQIYNDDMDLLMKFIRYIMFKMDCVREQEELGLRIDVEHCKTTLVKLEQEKEEKIRELIIAMPKVGVKRVKTKPKVLNKKDGSFSVQGELWWDLCRERNISPETTKEITLITGQEEANPNSHEQVKNWLYSLGWIPEHIKHVRDKEKGTTKKIPQIASKEAAREGTGEICPSIKKLYHKEPKLELLEGLSVASHRIGILKGFLEDVKGGDRLYPTSAGLTNTLRLKHSIVVNLPAVDKKYGKEVRGSIIADEDHILCGADLARVEDMTKLHYIYNFDPEYVKETLTPGFDAHLEIGLLAGMLTQEEVDFYKGFDKNIANKEEKDKYGIIKAKRNRTKIVNFSATYKIGAEALARNSGLSLKEAKRLLEIYWKRNKAILDVEKSLAVKNIRGQMWQQNPVNKYWYSLRAEKDRFSTLNQGKLSYALNKFV